MNARERFTRTLKFEAIDRIPLVEWPIREATMREWISQGYPSGVTPQEFFSLDTLWLSAPFNIRILPPFEEKIVEQDENYKIWVDGLGALRKDFKDDRNPGFVTRSWLRHPVENREDFLQMKKRYDFSDRLRFPGNFKELSAGFNDALAPVIISIPFLFWTARDWLGFENLCLSFYDNPELLHEMFGFITDFTIGTLETAYRHLRIDVIELEEDMAYKGAPMVSPGMFREFMFPHYRRFIDFAKRNGTDIVMVDCDGNPGGLIPMWIEAGADAMSPCEVAAGVDVIRMRKQYPGFGLLGGIDKRELSKDRKSIYREVMSKVPEMIEKGGYIPHVDHAVPFDVPLANYSYFRKLMAGVASGAIPGPPVE
ncbi:MAG: uroporphyrinogen decarboxylase family protein [Clostridia bacterium]